MRLYPQRYLDTLAQFGYLDPDEPLPYLLAEPGRQHSGTLHLDPTASCGGTTHGHTTHRQLGDLLGGNTRLCYCAGNLSASPWTSRVAGPVDAQLRWLSTPTSVYTHQVRHYLAQPTPSGHAAVDDAVRETVAALAAEIAAMSTNADHQQSVRELVDHGLHKHAQYRRLAQAHPDDDRTSRYGDAHPVPLPGPRETSADGPSPYRLRTWAWLYYDGEHRWATAWVDPVQDSCRVDGNRALLLIHTAIAVYHELDTEHVVGLDNGYTAADVAICTPLVRDGATLTDAMAALHAARLP